MVDDKDIKKIIEATASNYGLKAVVVNSAEMVIVSREGYWPVSIPLVSIVGYPNTNESIIDRLAKKIEQSGICVKARNKPLCNS